MGYENLTPSKPRFCLSQTLRNPEFSVPGLAARPPEAARSSKKPLTGNELLDELKAPPPRASGLETCSAVDAQRSMNTYKTIYTER